VVCLVRRSFLLVVLCGCLPSAWFRVCLLGFVFGAGGGGGGGNHVMVYILYRRRVLLGPNGGGGVITPWFTFSIAIVRVNPYIHTHTHIYTYIHAYRLIYTCIYRDREIARVPGGCCCSAGRSPVAHAREQAVQLAP